MDKLRKSYVSGAGEHPLTYETIGEAFDRIVGDYGEREALVVCHQDIRWTYRELAAEVEKAAAGLVALGLEKGDRVGVWAPNSAEWVVMQYATAKAGLIQVNINPAYRISELEYALNKVGCKALALASAFKSSDYVAMMAELAPELKGQKKNCLELARLPALEHLILFGDEPVPGYYRYRDILELGRDRRREELIRIAASLDPDDAINIQFTSGTTGSPKGATLSHFNIVNNGFFTGASMRITEQDRICVPVPLYHCFGMVLGNLAALMHGAAVVYPNDGFDPGLTLKAVHDERCTALYGVPTMFIAELERPDFAKYDLTSLRTGIMAGAACPIELMKKVVGDMHMGDFTIAYGMTETSPISFQTHPDDSLERRVSTVGRIHPHVEVKIVDEAGRVVAPGEKGELMTRGYSVMIGYWGDEDKTAEAIDPAGWMHTGDLATLDGDGYCRIVGRLKDMVIRGGENIYPREVEEFLFHHPAIEDVAVFGIPDKKYGEALCAWVKLKEAANLSKEELRTFCDGQIAHYKIPKHIRFVDAFPMTVTGKIQKFVMRDQIIADLAAPATGSEKE